MTGGAVLVASLDAFSWLNPGSTSANTSTNRWVLKLDSFAAGDVLETEPVGSNEPFTALCVAWPVRTIAEKESHSAAIELATSLDGSNWSGWYSLHPDPHAISPESSHVFAAPLLRYGRYFKLRIDSTTAIAMNEIVVNAVDTTGSGIRTLNEDKKEGEDDEWDYIDGFIIPRVGWGADESWRHIDQDPEAPIAWPPEYAPIEKIIIHHTATEYGYDDPAAMVRAIYNYHAVILDWGDIGYNFLIDWAGNVYEGRFGGPNVIGGHALQYNPGSIGIALVGDYTDAAPTAASLAALESLIWTRASHVDVTQATDFVDLGGVPNLCGHGDVMATDCPGAAFQMAIPEFRGQLAGTGPIYFEPPVLLEDPHLTDVVVTPSIVTQGELIKISATVRNDGKNELPTQGPDPGFIYDEGEDFQAAGFPKDEGCFRLAVDINWDNATANPYRWGFGSNLGSGEDREIVGYIRASEVGAKEIRTTIVKELIQYYENESFIRYAHTLHPLTSMTAELSDPTVRYFPETGHNVPEIFVSYWQSNGGLMRFGYPLTEAFFEISETDGGEYLTQYFERARFEHHPEFAGTVYEVLLGHLGAERTSHRRGEAPFLPIPSQESDSDIVYFHETGHTTSYRFLEYWYANGGVQTFGYPISEKFDEISPTDGKVHLVQYFERNRFEYHPEVEKWEDQILLGHLGREILIERGWLPGPEFYEHRGE